VIDAGAVAAQARALVPGSQMPDVVRTPTRVSCFLFAVAWWAPHRVHYDIELARAEGYEDVMVPGLLLNEYVVSALTGWTGDPLNLRRMDIRNLAPAYAGDRLLIESSVAEVADHGERVEVTFQYEITRTGPDGGERVAVAAGRGTVEVAGSP